MIQLRMWCLRSVLVCSTSDVLRGYLEAFKVIVQAWLGLERQEGVVAWLKPRGEATAQTAQTPDAWERWAPGPGLGRFCWASGSRKRSAGRGLPRHSSARSATLALPALPALPGTAGGSEHLSKIEGVPIRLCVMDISLRPKCVT